MNGISNYSVRPSTSSSVTNAVSKASDSNSFGPMMTNALSAAAVASAPTSSAVCAISKEGLTELAKVSRDAYRTADAAAHYIGKELSDAGEAISNGASAVAHTVSSAIDSAETYVGHAVIAGVNAFHKFV